MYHIRPALYASPCLVLAEIALFSTCFPVLLYPQCNPATWRIWHGLYECLDWPGGDEILFAHPKLPLPLRVYFTQTAMVDSSPAQE